MFIISLDLELLWGVLDSKGDQYYKNLNNVHKVVPALLELFNKYNVSCTWATVGALLCENKDDLAKSKPDLMPSYKIKEFCNLSSINVSDPDLSSIIYAPNLVKKILSFENQELASHTFSHYYTLEEGQTSEQFDSDLKAHRKIMSRLSHTCSSIVFPRNQVRQDYLKLCKMNGLNVYRGTPSHWAFCSKSKFNNNLFSRVFRLIDTYIALWDCTQELQYDFESQMLNTPASLFLRPFSSRLSFLEGFKLRRIKYAMTNAAKKGRLFHLWWHPHNFGSNINQNLELLEEILLHYSYLNNIYDFKSVTMKQTFEFVERDWF